LRDRKYDSSSAYLAALLRRAPLRLALRDLVRWAPLRDPRAGYTVVIAAMRDLAEVCYANLELVGRMDLSACRELIVVMDCLEVQTPPGFARRVGELVPQVSSRVLTYSSAQNRAARLVDWGWVYSWLSWCKGVGACRTRHVLLHDLDAMPLDQDLFERQYRAAERTGAAFLGGTWYTSSGFREEDRLATTFELVIDAEFVRGRFRPIDAFNDNGVMPGGDSPRYMDFDTFLMMQRRAGRSEVEPIDEGAMVHPSQLICQYTDLVAGRMRGPHPRCTLPMLPYFLYLGGKGEALRQIIAQVRERPTTLLPLGRLRFDISGVSPGHAAYLMDQIERLETVLWGAVRPEIAEYVGALERAMGISRREHELARS
jgi:hypothetical protein